MPEDPVKKEKKNKEKVKKHGVDSNDASYAVVRVIFSFNLYTITCKTQLWDNIIAILLPFET